jgi:transcription elongation factor Elf1
MRRAKRKTKIHLAKSPKWNMPACGTQGWSIKIAEDLNSVTCQACKETKEWRRLAEKSSVQKTPGETR